MRCASCSSESPAGARFCIECGSSFQSRCPSCGGENLPQAKFCAACGTALSVGRKLTPAQSGKGKGGQTPRRAPRPQGRSTPTKPQGAAPEAERRQLTVMFCDLVDSIALSAQLDPEEWREVVRAYQQTSTVVIERYDGHIAQYLGDGLLVYFGYPGAHEDDAQRAARAGLGILAALHDLNTRLRRPVQVRIGIHTGLVVVGEIGEGGKREHLALGDTPNIAARLQGLAEPDTVVISTATYRLITGLLDCRNLGLHAVKGISTPLQVYQVIGESGIRSRLDVAVATGLAPLVGREEEVRLLLRRWEQAQSGEGQVVLLSGEAGIGKSRLVQALKEQVAAEQGTRIEFRCSSYYQNSALYPLIEHIQRLLHFGSEDTPQDKLRKLEQDLREYPLPLQEVVPLFAVLLSLPHPTGYPPLNWSPQKQKQKLQEALVTWLLAEAERRPVLVVWEDLHWVDPSTLEVLSLCMDRVPSARLLLLLTFRPDFHPPWAMLSHLTQVTLSRLGGRHVEEIVQRVTGGKALPGEVLHQVVQKTDGVPLFVEELTKMVVESGLLRETEGHYKLMGALPPLAIPTTLQDSLVARLDRLAAVKEVAQLGATLGREFSYEVLQAVAPVDEASLRQALARLVEAEVLYQRGLPPSAQYLFKHALIQDAAYQSLLKSTRQQYHQQIAQVLEQRFTELVETQPELMGHHYTEAGLTEQATPYWQRAGERASQRSANVEAISYLTKGLELLKALPDTPARAQQELMLQIALGAPLMATKGFAGPEVEQTYRRAYELCQQVGESPQLFPVLWGLDAFYITRAELQRARKLGEQLLGLAKRVADPAFLLEAHRSLGQTLLFFGEFPAAHAHFEHALSLYTPQQHRSLISLYGRDPGAASLSYEAWTLWFLGYPEQAQQRQTEALTLTRELAHPFSLAFALVFAASLHQLRRESRPAQQATEAAEVLATEQGFAQVAAIGTVWRGWALVEQAFYIGNQRQAEDGIVLLRQGLAACRATGSEAARPWYLALLAEAHGKVGRPEEGLTALNEALTIAHTNGEYLYKAEQYRLKGELTLQKFQVPGFKFQVANPRPLALNPEAEAEACFHKAIEIARQQQAKSLELRAATSLARLWQQQDKQQEAYAMLSDIYNWFTEGFDTKDLQEAKALLEELSHRAIEPLKD